MKIVIPDHLPLINDNPLTIAIVSYNSYTSICNCLSNLISQTRHKVIIVDNASPDNSGARIKQQFDSVTLLQLQQNIGYGRAANRAIELADTPYLLLLNPDLIATADDVDQLLSRMLGLGNSAAILAPAVTQKDFLGEGLVQRNWVIGAAMLLNLEALKPVGYFDENIFLFSEETDLCYRARQAGLEIWLDTSLYVEHLYRQSSTPSAKIEALKNWHVGWSHMYYYTKHGLARGKKNPKRVLLQYGLKYLTATNAKKKAMYKARFEGTLAFMRGQAAFCPDGNPRS